MLIDYNLLPGLNLSIDCLSGKQPESFFLILLLIILMPSIAWEAPIKSLGGSSYFVSLLMISVKKIKKLKTKSWVYMLKMKHFFI